MNIFDDKYMMKVVYALLAVISIIIDGPIVSIISIILAVAFLVYKFKQSKNDPEKGMDFMLDVAIISIVIIINLGLTLFRIGTMYNANKYYKMYSDSSYESMTAEDFVSLVISEFKMRKMKSGGEYTYNETKQVFKELLEETGLSVTAKGNKMTVDIGEEKVTFAFSTDGEITYTIK